jgi:hypothetical protein
MPTDSHTGAIIDAPGARGSFTLAEALMATTSGYELMYISMT